MNTFNTVLDFLKQVVFTTFSQLIWLLGLLFIFGLLLYFLARITRITYVKTVGWKLDVFVTGWIGTPIHELGHAIFCILFRHKIVEMKLFSPNSEDGTIGYVNHAYNPRSTFQRIGNFFIGVGPIIFGAFVLYALLYFLVPNYTSVFNSIESQAQSLVASVQGKDVGVFASLWNSTTNAITQLFDSSNFGNYKFWIFLYLSMCIASHMQLSPPDIKGAWSGLISLVIFVIILNTVLLLIEATGLNAHLGSYWQHFQINTYASSINKWVGQFGALFVYASIISAINFIITYVILNIYSLIRGRGIVNPLW